jgi:ribosomal protein L7Ae-like RNA K-turn-binding protein
MKNKEKILTMLGFAQKSGKLVSGESAVKAMLSKNQIYLLIIAEDISDNRKKYWAKVTELNNIPCLIIGNKFELGLSIGLSQRSILGITDRQMAKAMQ